MGKHEVGTPKYIANKIKSKGLQKLRWYCQMCEKQCRDENGFKCHTMSESHHRQLLLFADNSSKYMNEFSRDFADGYLKLLKRQFGTKRVPANRVYQEYITDKDHCHMNSTMWLTLTAFVKWLGKTGKCTVDETEKGWFVTYIDRDPETIAAQEKKEKKEKMDRDDQEKMMHFISKQIKKAKATNDPNEPEFKQPLERSDDAPIVLGIKLKPKKVQPVLMINNKKHKKIEQEELKIKEEVISDQEEDEKEKYKDNLKRIKEDEDFKVPSKKAKIQSEDKQIKGWLRENICVKIITKTLGSKYYKAKGSITEIMDDNCFVAKLKLTSPEEVKNHVIKIDQEFLETVIPSPGKEVMILSGKYEGKIAIIDKVHFDDYNVDVELKDKRKIVKGIAYEDICKYVC